MATNETIEAEFDSPTYRAIKIVSNSLLVPIGLLYVYYSYQSLRIMMSKRGRPFHPHVCWCLAQIHLGTMMHSLALTGQAVARMLNNATTLCKWLVYFGWLAGDLNINAVTVLLFERIAATVFYKNYEKWSSKMFAIGAILAMVRGQNHLCSTQNSHYISYDKLVLFGVGADYICRSDSHRISRIWRHSNNARLLFDNSNDSCKWQPVTNVTRPINNNIYFHRHCRRVFLCRSQN